jgi:malonyl CoA-acyl carrier protein transacylase
MDSGSHSVEYKPNAVKLQKVLEHMPMPNLKIPVVSNCMAKPYQDPKIAAYSLAHNFAEEARIMNCIEYLFDQNVDTFLDLSMLQMNSAIVIANAKAKNIRVNLI